MATNQKLRRAVREKLGISRQALDQRAQVLKKKLPMSDDDAVAVVGHRHGVDLARLLDTDALSRVAGYVAQLNGGSGVGTSKTRGGRTALKPVLVQIAGIDVEAVPGMTAAHAREAEMMSRKAYPLLYVFENSARDVITRVLKAGVGDDWWTKVVPSKVQQKATSRMKDEGEEAWHSKRGAVPIQYVDLLDLAKIVRDPKAWPYFKPLFHRETWFDSVIDDLNVSRRVVGHMNPLSSDDIKQVETGFRKWVKQLKAKEALLP